MMMMMMKELHKSHEPSNGADETGKGQRAGELLLPVSVWPLKCHLCLLMCCGNGRGGAGLPQLIKKCCGQLGKEEEVNPASQVEEQLRIGREPEKTTVPNRKEVEGGEGWGAAYTPNAISHAYPKLTTCMFFWRTLLGRSGKQLHRLPWGWEGEESGLKGA